MIIILAVLKMVGEVAVVVTVASVAVMVGTVVSSNGGDGGSAGSNDGSALRTVPPNKSSQELFIYCYHHIFSQDYHIHKKTNHILYHKNDKWVDEGLLYMKL